MSGANFLCNGKLNFMKLIMRDDFSFSKLKITVSIRRYSAYWLTIDDNDDIIILIINLYT